MGQSAKEVREAIAEHVRKVVETLQEQVALQTALEQNNQNSTAVASTSTDSTPSSSTTTTTASTGGGYMDWMTSEYGDKENNKKDIEEKRPFDIVWGPDSKLAQMNVNIVQDHLKRNLQQLVNAYHESLANNVGQKRT